MSAGGAAPAVDARRLGQEERGDGLAARNAVLKEGDEFSFSVRRSDEDGGSRLEEYTTVYRKHMRVLDALNDVAASDASDLAYRWFCGSKMCGSCGVRINGREGLACWEAVAPGMVIEPLRNLPVLRDLVVDRKPYEDKVASLEPWLERRDDYAGFPEPLTQREMRLASTALECISCMLCYSACPVIGLGDLTKFAGPAPLVQFGQTALDPRNSDEKVARGLEQTNIFACISCYKCEEVCPAHIPIVSEVIEPLKEKAARLTPKQARHALVFRSIVAARGRIDPGELILRLQGWRILGIIPRTFRLWRRGKIKPVRTLLRLKTASASAARRILLRGEMK